MKQLAILFLCGSVISTATADVFVAGRDYDDGRDAHFGVSVGTITEFRGMVEETTRSLYDVTGETWKQETAESYDLDDFNLDDSYPTFGIVFENAGKYFTFQMDLAYMAISSDAVAQRDYYLAVDSIVFNGVEYDNFMIPEGRSFSFDFQGASIETHFLFTPFTFRPAEGFRLIPFLSLGLFGYVGQYDIEAGESVGIKEYQNPIEEFVIGGKVDGLMGMGLPEYGGGLELRLGTADSMNFVIQGRYNVCQYDGSTSFLTSRSHRDKNADIDHWNAQVKAFAEFPLRDGRSWMLGAEYQQIQSEGLISQTEEDPEQIIANRERFDKEFEFGTTTFNAFVGLTF